jgi:hypothetical protein
MEFYGTTCPKCGAGGLVIHVPKKESDIIWAGKVVAGLCLLLVLVSLVSPLFTRQPPPAPYVAQLTKDQKDYFAELHSQGFLDLEEEKNRAYVAPDLWWELDIHTKEKFAAALAAACADHDRQSAAGFVDIYNRQSGKKLAKWSYIFGFKVE